MPLSDLKQPRHDIWVNAVFFLAALGSLFLVSRVLGPDTLRSWVDSAGVFAPLAFVLAKASTIVIAPLAGAFLYPLAGASFGLTKGILLGVLGDALGSTIAFWISRTFGRPLAEKFLGNDSGMLGQVLTMIGTVRGFFAARFILITAHDLLAYAAGLTRLPFLPFIVIQVGASLIPTSILTGLGSSLFSDSGVSFGWVFGAMMGIGVFSSLAFMAYTYTQTKKTDAPSNDVQKQELT